MPASPPVLASSRYAPAPFGSITAGGELGRRARLSFARLEKYEPKVALAGNEGWPGDREGRAILGQTLIAQATKQPSRHVEALIAGVGARLNAKGYMGEPLPADVVDEQVMSGNGWVLRGLAEHHLWKRDEASRALIERIVAGLYLPAKGTYARYPLTAAERPRSDKADVSFTAKQAVSGWRLSTDVGCAFIALDGVTAAYEVLRTPALAALIEEMVTRFRALDVLAVNAQTHATLSATRGVLRYATLAGRPDLVAFAESMWSTYKTRGMTDHYANDNWFNRPQWTEGCAIVDAYDLPLRLFAATGNAAYLEDAQLVYWNGIGFNQRPNGGFGCDTCPGSDGQWYLAPFAAIFEAPACCSMRGAEGIARAVAASFLVRADGVLLPDFHDAEATLPLAGGEVTLRERTRWPYDGRVSVDVVRSTSQGVIDLRLLLPSWVDRSTIVAKTNGKPTPLDEREGAAVFRIEAKPGFRVELAFPMNIRSVAPVNAAKVPAMHGFRHGPLVLGLDAPAPHKPAAAKAPAAPAPPKPAAAPPVAIAPDAAFAPIGRASYRVKGGKGETLRPVTGLAFVGEAKAKATRRQILFPRA